MQEVSTNEWSIYWGSLRMEKALQHEKTAFSTGIPAPGTGGHHPNRPDGCHALTFKLGPLVGAGHTYSLTT